MKVLEEGFMTVSLTTNETVAVLRLSGDISLADMESMLQDLTDLVLHNQKSVVMNFRQVTHVSLNAISRLAERNLRFRALGGDIKLACMIPYVANLFKLVGAFSRFEILASEEEAVARFEC
jgi:anti-anti-sigma factor